MSNNSFYKSWDKKTNNHNKTNTTNPIRLYYKGINKFEVANIINTVQEPMKLNWNRVKLREWELVSIDIPYEILIIQD